MTGELVHATLKAKQNGTIKLVVLTELPITEKLMVTSPIAKCYELHTEDNTILWH